MWRRQRQRQTAPARSASPLLQFSMPADKDLARLNISPARSALPGIKSALWSSSRLACSCSSSVHRTPRPSALLQLQASPNTPFISHSWTVFLTARDPSLRLQSRPGRASPISSSSGPTPSCHCLSCSFPHRALPRSFSRLFSDLVAPSAPSVSSAAPIGSNRQAQSRPALPCAPCSRNRAWVVFCFCRLPSGYRHLLLAGPCVVHRSGLRSTGLALP